MRPISLIFAIVLSIFTNAQNFSTWGKEFFVPNTIGFLTIETDHATTVTITDLGNGVNYSYNYDANTSNVVAMSYNSPFSSFEPYFDYPEIQNSIKIVSTENINLRYSESLTPGGGNSMILPSDQLGTEYTISTHHLQGLQQGVISSMIPILFITSPQDNTSLEIVLNHPNANNFPVNTPFNVTLNEGEVLVIRGPFCALDDPITGCYSHLGEPVTSDFSGSKIKVLSDCKTVSVHYYTGGYLTYPDIYGLGACCSDRMMEQYLPDHLWGNEFYMIPEQHIDHGNMLKVYSKYDNNELFINGNLVRSLNSNETFDTLLFNPSYIKTSKQSFASHYFLSARIGESEIHKKTDPELLFLLPINYQSNKGTFSFPQSIYSELENERWISLLTKTDNVENILLDGISIPQSSFTPFSSSNYSWCHIPLSEADHTVEALQGSFQAIVNGNARASTRASYVGVNEYKESDDSTKFAEIICFEDEEIELFAPIEADNITWSTGDESYSIIINEPGLYSVSSVDECGNPIFTQYYLVTYNCDELMGDPELISCEFEPHLIPNVFTPNNDNVNDFYEFNLPDCFSKPNFIIRNRWGNIVYSSTENEIKWDGLINGTAASDGTYFWTLNANDEKSNLIIESGFLTIKK